MREKRTEVIPFICVLVLFATVLRADTMKNEQVGSLAHIQNATTYRIQHQNEPYDVSTAKSTTGIATDAEDLSIVPDDNGSDLVSALVVPNTGLTVTYSEFSGAATAAGLFYDGPFSIDDGIILASGDVTNALPPDESQSTSTDFGLPGCDWCDDIIPGYVSYDAAIFNIEFNASEACSSISFDFVFGSEEYPEFVGSQFNDVFGAYLNGTQISFDEFDAPITINGPFFSSGYVQTPPGNGMEYDGSTLKLTTTAPVTPGSSGNSLVFVVCDAGDYVYDSGVFLASLQGGASADTCTGIAPDFVHPPTPECGETLHVSVSEAVTFQVEAVDIGPNQDVVTLTATGLPAGSSMTPALPAVGNPVTSTFSWTPSTSDIGVHALTFTATDNEMCEFKDICEFFISVEGAEGPYPTNEWINVYCYGPMLNGVPLVEGDVIKAYDPDGVLCGMDIVREDGSFGFMPIYRDDFVTPDFDEGADPGDVISFTINDMEVNTDPVIYWTSNGEGFELCRFFTCKIIHLDEGWNLISWNLDYSAETSDFVLDHLNKCECVDVILSFDQGAQTYDPLLPQYSTLPNVDYYHGYWLRMQCPWDLEICGDAIDPSEFINIYTGWNLVSYWPTETLPVETGFASILDCIEIAIGFDNGGQVWIPGKEPFNTLTDLNELFGYWIKSSCDGALVYPGWNPPEEAGFEKTIAGNIDPVPSRNWMSLYGSNIEIDGNLIDDNSIVEAYTTSGTLCGRGVYSGGMLKFTPVYGRDNLDEASVGYPMSGDQISIYVNDVRVYPDLTWTGNGDVVGLTELSTKAGVAGQHPAQYDLAQNYPNPFNPTTVVSFSLPVAGHVELAIYNLLGQKIRTLVDAEMTAGTHSETWDATDDSGEHVASGVYFYRIEASDFTQTKKMLLTK